MNQVKVSNSATGNAPLVESTGGDSNVGLDISSKGTGGITAWAGAKARELLKLLNVASAVNEVTISPSATGNPVKIEATGDDTNVDMKLVAKGTAYVFNEDPAAASATVATGETTTSTSYTDLATPGPAVTVKIGPSGMALVIITGQANNNTGSSASNIGFAISGANTLAAGDERALLLQDSVAAHNHAASWAYLATGLTPGSSTFTCKYAVSGGTGTFLRRYISVVAL